MATTPTRLQVGTSYNEAIPLLNGNFDNVIQDIRDLGANVSTSLTLTVTVPASSLNSQVVTLTSQGVTSTSVNQVFTTKPVSGTSGISPLLDIYVDVDNSPNNLFPYGATLTSGQLSLFPIVTILNTGFANSVGAWLIQLNNRDIAAHTYYVHTSCGYFPTGATGMFR
jgi:hypothetical protein